MTTIEYAINAKKNTFLIQRDFVLFYQNYVTLLVLSVFRIEKNKTEQ